MQTKSYLVQDDCRRIVDAAAAFARSKNWAVTICVCDDGGHILRIERLDGAPPFTARMAIAKATTAAVGRRESKSFEDSINQGRAATDSQLRSKACWKAASRHHRWPGHRSGRCLRGQVGGRRRNRPCSIAALTA